MRTIIVSDIHISAGSIDGHSKFLETHFCEFIKTLSDSYKPAELIINGDFLDFVQAPPWEDTSSLLSKTEDGINLCFTENQSIEKLENIIDTHLPVFDALKEFLTVNVNNCIRILPGNHDVDMFWPSIRNRLAEVIEPASLEGSQRLVFHLEDKYTFIRYGKKYWIEHGHQQDINNRFKVKGKYYWSEKLPPILKDVEGIDRLICCDGSYALINYVNHLSADYPAINNIHPWSLLISALLTPRSPIGFRRALIVCQQLYKFLTHDIDITSTLGADDFCADTLNKLIHSMSVRERDEFSEFLSCHGLDLHIPIEAFVETKANCQHLLWCGYFSSSQTPVSTEDMESYSSQVLGYAGSTLLGSERRRLVKRSNKLNKEKKVDYFIAGHTHNATLSNVDGVYHNSGCWIPNMSVNNLSEVNEVIKGSITLPCLLTYIEPDEKGKPIVNTYLRG